MRKTALLLLVLFGAPALHAEAPLDVTLIIGGDVEVGMSGRGMTDQIARNHALAMRELLGTDGGRLRWPAGTSGEGEEIGKPSGIFIAGDLAADNSIREGSASWNLLTELYLGPEPAAGAPGYLGWGNHDIYDHSWWFTALGGAENNGSTARLIRRQTNDVVASFDHYFGLSSSTPPHYAVRKQRLLIVHLNTHLGEPCRRSNFVGAPAWYDLGVYAETSSGDCPGQKWLRDTLAEHRTYYGEKAPVLIVQHYGYDGFGMSAGGYRGYWWHPDARDALDEIVQPANVIGFFHGHTHWERFTPKGTSYPHQLVFRGDVTSSKRDVGFVEGRAWADVNGDGKADYCRVTGANWGQGTVRCAISTGTGFGADVVSGSLDVGYWEGRGWADVNGDGKADYCRVTGANAGQGRVQCAISTGTGFGAEVVSGSLDVGYHHGRGWADVNGDGKADYCRVTDADWGHSGRVRCAISTGGGFGADVVSDALDVGYWQGRAWADFDGDGKADYCRVTDANWDQGRVRCAISTGHGFGADVASDTLDVGYWEGRGWADVNGDAKADYCRLTNSNYAIGVVRCRLSQGTSFGHDVTSPASEPGQNGIDAGYPEGRAWVDFDADGRADYCRAVLDGRVECTVFREDSFPAGTSIRSLPLDDAGFADSRAWADVNGDGRSDFCRVIDQNWGEGRVRCTLGAVTTTVVPVDSYGVASGYCTGTFSGGFTVVRVTDTHLDVVPVNKTTDHCADAQYDGSVTVNAGLVRSVPITTK